MPTCCTTTEPEYQNWNFAGGVLAEIQSGHCWCGCRAVECYSRYHFRCKITKWQPAYIGVKQLVGRRSSRVVIIDAPLSLLKVCLRMRAAAWRHCAQNFVSLTHEQIVVALFLEHMANFDRRLQWVIPTVNANSRISISWRSVRLRQTGNQKQSGLQLWKPDGYNCGSQMPPVWKTWT